MRIVYDHQVFGSQKYGGISRYFFELANHLATTHLNEVNIVAPLFVNRYLENASANLKVYGKPVPQIQRTGRMISSFNKFLCKSITQKIQPDIVHETYYSPKSFAPHKSKVVVSVFDMIHERFPKYFPHCDTTLKEKKLAVERADHVICISFNTQKDLIETLGVATEKTSVVHLGFTLTNDGNINNLHGMLPNKPFLLYVGMREGYKNFENLLRAYTNSSRIQNEFNLITFGGGKFSAKEQKLIAKLNLGTGYVHNLSGNDSTLAALYKAATAFVFPSLYEGFGIPPLEAMQYECPVICSKTSSIPEVVGDAGEYFDPYSVDDLQQSLENVLYDNKYRDTLINRGRNRIKLYSWERCAKETMQVYNKVLA